LRNRLSVSILYIDGFPERLKLSEKPCFLVEKCYKLYDVEKIVCSVEKYLIAASPPTDIDDGEPSPLCFRIFPLLSTVSTSIEQSCDIL
jgi:hypothetical protein